MDTQCCCDKKKKLAEDWSVCTKCPPGTQIAPCSLISLAHLLTSPLGMDFSGHCHTSDEWMSINLMSPTTDCLIGCNKVLTFPVSPRFCTAAHAPAPLLGNVTLPPLHLH